MMMDPRKMKLIEELKQYLEDSQGGELARLMEEHGKPKSTDGLGLAGEDSGEMPEGMDKKDPKGLSLEKVSVMPGGEPDGDEMPGDMGKSGDDEPSDDELLELLKKYSS